ncbi:hypothetical protein DMENIID0001_093160 [Sergentomyia squamirostris]
MPNILLKNPRSASMMMSVREHRKRNLWIISREREKRRHIYEVVVQKMWRTSFQRKRNASGLVYIMRRARTQLQRDNSQHIISLGLGCSPMAIVH